MKTQIIGTSSAIAAQGVFSESSVQLHDLGALVHSNDCLLYTSDAADE